MGHKIDEGHRAMVQIVDRHRLLNLADANEADTRRKVIDAVLHDVLGWTVDDINYEERVSEDGNTTFADYIIRVASTAILIEAKRVGADFQLPLAKKDFSLRLGGVLSEGSVGAAIRQARDYCRKKSIPFAAVTNGSAWIIFPAVRTDLVPFEESEARVFRSLDDIKTHLVNFWELLSRERVTEGNLEVELLNPKDEDSHRRIVRSLVKEPGFRIGRNALYQYIEPAVMAALTDESLLANADALAACYVKSTERVKFDSRLSMYLKDTKPPLGHKTVRVRVKKKSGDVLDEKIRQADSSPPRFILLLGPVGAGKTTFLHYTRKVSAASLIDGRLLWLMVDFKKATKNDNPREFLYRELIDIVESDQQFQLGDWDKSIRYAYQDEIQRLMKGPLHLVAKTNPAEFDKQVAEMILAERTQKAPYVDKILRASATKRPGYLVIDNVDQIDDLGVQEEIFVEAQAAARRSNMNVIMCLRDATYLRHRNSPAFDAFQFDSIYVDAPQVRPVLSRRFTYAKKVLAGKSAFLTAESGMKVNVRDLSVFFEIVATSLLSDSSGYMIDVMAGGDVRRGLHLVREFLASGNTNADHALTTYLSDGIYVFPRHEILRGAILGQRRYYSEAESLMPNVYDAKLGIAGLQLFRFHVMAGLVSLAAHESFEGLLVDELATAFNVVGVSERDVNRVLQTLYDFRAISTADGMPLNGQSRVLPTRLAGFLLRDLCHDFTFSEFCLIDTAIYDDVVWAKLAAMTASIESTHDKKARITLRIQRVREFVDYLVRTEERWVVECKRRKVASEWAQEVLKEQVLPSLLKDLERVEVSAAKNY